MGRLYREILNNRLTLAFTSRCDKLHRLLSAPFLRTFAGSLGQTRGEE